MAAMGQPRPSSDHWAPLHEAPTPPTPLITLPRMIEYLDGELVWCDTKVVLQEQSYTIVAETDQGYTIDQVGPPEEHDGEFSFTAPSGTRFSWRPGGALTVERA